MQVSLLGVLLLPALNPLHAGDFVPGYSTLFSTGQNWGSLTSLWDGQWYRSIVEDGYAQNYSLSSHEITNWAFFPLYPSLIWVLGHIGIPFWLAGSAISVASTAVGLTILFKLCYTKTGSLWVGVFAILPLLINPAFFITLCTYTEGLSLLIISLVLYGLVNKKYCLVATMLLFAGATRGVGVPLFILIACYVGVHFYKTRRLPKDSPRKITKKMYLILGAAILAAALWPLTVALNLGSLTASLDLLAIWTNIGKYPLWVIPLVAGLIYLIHRKSNLPWVWKLWSVVYMAYILAATVTTFGIFRYFILALVPIPLFAEKLSPKLRAGVYIFAIFILLGCGALGQFYWLSRVWIVTSPFYMGGIAIP